MIYRGCLPDPLALPPLLFPQTPESGPVGAAEPFVLLDDATAAPGEASSRLYTGFAREDALPDAAALGTLDAMLAEGWRQGWHATLFAPYEFRRPAGRRCRSMSTARCLP
ncbi:hypothetical protein ACU4GD_35750 [Cupriavidus basilensis]